jgi:hypothetical protein
MTMRRLLLPLLCTPLFFGCESDPRDPKAIAEADSLRAAVAVEIREASLRDKEREVADRDREAREREVAERRRCDAADGLPASIERIMSEPREYAANDACSARLMDALVERFIHTNEKQYLETLDALSRAGDSKTNEILGSAVLDLFRARPVELIQHLYSLQGDPASTEVDALLVSEIQLGRNSAFDSEIRTILERLELGDDLTTDQKRYLARIESQFWASAG